MAAFYIKNGRLMHSGVEVKELGVNIPDLSVKCLSQINSVAGYNALNTCTVANPANYQTNYDTNFAYLISQGIRVVRFFLFGLRPATFTEMWVTNQATFLTNLDALVAAAEARGILLIPSIFASGTQIPTHNSESLDQIGVAASATRIMMAAVTTLLVNRYKNSPAIAMWEFGNEYDNKTNNASATGFSVSSNTPVTGFSDGTQLGVGALGTPATWNYPEDYYGPDTVHNAVAAFHTLAKSLDTAAAYSGEASRCTSSGHQGYRLSEAGLTTPSYDSWLKDRFYDDPTDTITIHAYQSNPFYKTNYSGYDTFLKRLRKSCEARGKPLIVGEFGVITTYAVDGISYLAYQDRVVANMCSAGIQLALLWNYPGIIGTDPTYSFRQDENRSAEWANFVAMNNKYKTS